MARKNKAIDEVLGPSWILMTMPLGAIVYGREGLQCPVYESARYTARVAGWRSGLGIMYSGAHHTLPVNMPDTAVRVALRFAPPRALLPGYYVSIRTCAAHLGRQVVSGKALSLFVGGKVEAVQSLIYT